MRAALLDEGDARLAVPAEGVAETGNELEPRRAAADDPDMMESDLVARIDRLATRSGGYRRAGPFLTPDCHRAIQNEPRSPSSHPEAAAQSDELGGL